MNSPKREILIAASSRALCDRLRPLLAPNYRLTFVDDVESVANTLRHRVTDLVILEALSTTWRRVVETGARMRAAYPHAALILMTDQGSERMAIATLRAGFVDYLNQDAADQDVLASVERSTSVSHAKTQPVEKPRLNGSERMIGHSSVMRDTKELIARIAPTDSNVLITGETGTGKELTAELVHSNSTRRHRPLVCINCAAVPDGLLESELFGYERGAFTGAFTASPGKLGMATGGTVFFDEIGDMSSYAQAKILRAIETKEAQRLGGRSVPLDLRIVAGTNQDLDSMVADKTFRADLYFRLNVARIHLPPLRERRSDLRLLAVHCINELNHRFGRRVRGLTEAALGELSDHDWPGNVRELRNLFEALFLALPPEVEGDVDLPESMRARLGSNGTRRNERERLLAALLSTNWNKSRAAEQLHWSRMTLYRKLTKYNLDRN